jgi:hypothetical protein
MTNTPINPMIEKLRKLIAHEQSCRSIGNLIEAEAFAAKIQDLLTAHKLSMSEVDFQAREDGEPIDWELVDGSELNGRSNRVKVYWRVKIARVIAKINSCQVVNNTSSRGRSFFFVGRTSDREIAKILYIYLINLGEELGAKSTREDKKVQSLKFNVHNNIASYAIPTWAAAAFRRWMKMYSESWKVGYSDAIVKRLEDRYEETLRAQTQTSANAIIHIKKDALAVEDFLKGKTKKGRGRLTYTDSNQDGYTRGHSTGSAVNLSPNTFSGATGRASRLLGE